MNVKEKCIIAPKVDSFKNHNNDITDVIRHEKVRCYF